MPLSQKQCFSTKCAMATYCAHTEIKAKSRSKPGLITKVHTEGTPYLLIPQPLECLDDSRQSPIIGALGQKLKIKYKIGKSCRCRIEIN